MTDTEYEPAGYDPLDELLVESVRVAARPVWVYVAVVLAIVAAVVVIGLLLAVALPLAADFVIAIQRATRALS